jgi:hypothetical protein
MVSVGAMSMSKCIDEMNQGNVSRQGKARPSVE